MSDKFLLLSLYQRTAFSRAEVSCRAILASRVRLRASRGPEATHCRRMTAEETGGSGRPTEASNRPEGEPRDADGISRVIGSRQACESCVNCRECGGRQRTDDARNETRWKRLQAARQRRRMVRVGSAS